MSQDLKHPHCIPADRFYWHAAFRPMTVNFMTYVIEKAPASSYDVEDGRKNGGNLR